MPATTPKGIRYPLSSDHKRLWEHHQAQASDTDALLGLFVCTSSTRPGSPFQGQQIYETDTKATGYWNGTAWVMTDFGFTEYTPTIVGETTNPNIGSTGSKWGGYQRLSGMCRVVLRILPSGTGIAIGSGTYHVSLPFLGTSTPPGAPATPFYGGGQISDTTQSGTAMCAVSAGAFGGQTANQNVTVRTTTDSGAVGFWAHNFWGVTATFALISDFTYPLG